MTPNLAIMLLTASLQTQAQAPDPAPLPDINTLMHQVEEHQRAAEAQQKDYIYRESSSLDRLDSHGNTKKNETRDFEIFWLNGVRVARLLKKDGKDLTPDEKKKEDEHIDKEVSKAKDRREKASAQGRETDSHGQDEITFSRMLELGAFSNARREAVNGRDAIAVDFTGDPKAKTHTTGEAVLHELAGTVWIDEQDKTIARLEGHFANNFKIGGGLLVNIRQGTAFRANFVKINDEAWFPEEVTGNGHIRYLLFFTLDGNFHGRTTDYRKFKATSSVLPGFTPAPPDLTPPPPRQQPTPSP